MLTGRKLLVLTALGVCAACSQHHLARVSEPRLPPPAVEMVRHTGNLWIELRPRTLDRQCRVSPGRRKLCFDGISRSLGHSLEQALWPSFQSVRVKRKGDNLDPGDYLLLVDVAVRPDQTGPGWSVSAAGSWQLVRDGIPLAGESIAPKSRADFYYGSSLGQGASEVIAAIALHVSKTVGQLPELRPEPEMSVPEVTAENPIGPLMHAPEAHAAR